MRTNNINSILIAHKASDECSILRWLFRTYVIANIFMRWKLWSSEQFDISITLVHAYLEVTYVLGKRHMRNLQNTLENKTLGLVLRVVTQSICCELFQETEPITTFKIEGRSLRSWICSPSYRWKLLSSLQNLDI